MIGVERVYGCPFCGSEMEMSGASEPLGARAPKPLNQCSVCDRVGKLPTVFSWSMGAKTLIRDNWTDTELTQLRKDAVRFVMEVINPFLRKRGGPIIQISGKPDHPMLINSLEADMKPPEVANWTK